MFVLPVTIIWSYVEWPHMAGTAVMLIKLFLIWIRLTLEKRSWPQDQKKNKKMHQALAWSVIIQTRIVCLCVYTLGYSVYSIVSAYCLSHHGIPQGSVRGPLILSLNAWLHCVLCLCMTTCSNICITALCYYLCIAECLEVINITTRSCLLLILVFATLLEVFHLCAAHFRESSPVYKFKALVYLNQERQ